MTTRRLIALSTLILGLQASGIAATAHAQDRGAYPEWQDVEYAWPAPGDPRRAPFDQLFSEARTRTVHLALFGSSLHSAPAGAGSIYIPALNHHLGLAYGNWPSSVIGAPSSYGSGLPSAAWLLRGASQNHEPTNVPSSSVPPGWVFRMYDHRTSPGHGPLWMLQHDAASLSDASGLRFGSYLKTPPHGSIFATIYAATMPGSQEIEWSTLPTDSSSPSYFTTAVQSGTTSMGLDSPQFSVKSETIGPLDYNDQKYMQLRLQAAAPGEVVIVGCRFHDAANPQGVVVTPLSAGGYRAHSVLLNHAGMGPAFRAFEFDAAILAYGANDMFTGASASQFHSDLLALIATIRSWNNDPEFPIILLSDAYREGGTPQQQAQYAMVPGVHKTIAENDPFVLAVNSRRALEESGFNAANENLEGTTDRGVWQSGAQYDAGDRVRLEGSFTEHFRAIASHAASAANRPGTGQGQANWVQVRRHLVSASDPVHLSPFGQRRKAAFDAALILGGLPGRTPCYADCDGNRVLNIDDFICFINEFAHGCP